MRSLSGHHVHTGGRLRLLLGFVVLAALLALALPGVARADGYVHLRTFGTPGSGAGQLYGPFYSCTDNDGYIYVSDSNDSRVEKFAPDGAFMLQWGTAGTNSGQFEYTYGICYDPSDDLICVCDGSNNRVQEFTRNGRWVRTVLSGTVSQPYGICWDGNHLVVADYGNQRIVQCFADGSVPYAWGSAQFAGGQPCGIAYDPQSGDYYVTDPINARVVQFDSSDSFVKYIGAGTLSAGGPIGVAADADGNLLVGDFSARNVYKFSAGGTLLGSIPSAGTVNAFRGPLGVSIDGQGRVYVVDDVANDVQVWAHDDTPPVITSDADGEWHSASLSVTLDAADDYSGVKGLFFPTMGGWQGVPFTMSLNADPVGHSTDGVWRETYYAEDGVGNDTTERILTLKIDTRPPVTSVSGVPTGWVKHDVILAFSAADRGSGVAGTAYSPNGGSSWSDVPDSDKASISTEGDNAIQFYSWDAAVPVANIEAVNTVHVLIDKTRPTVVALANASVLRGAKVTLRYRLADNLSPTCTVKLIIKNTKGKVVKTIAVASVPTTTTPTAHAKTFTCTLPVGKYTWSCQAIDEAGNSFTSTAKNLTVR